MGIECYFYRWHNIFPIFWPKKNTHSCVCLLTWPPPHEGPIMNAPQMWHLELDLDSHNVHGVRNAEEYVLREEGQLGCVGDVAERIIMGNKWVSQSVGRLKPPLKIKPYIVRNRVKLAKAPSCISSSCRQSVKALPSQRTISKRMEWGYGYVYPSQYNSHIQQRGSVDLQPRVA